MTVETSARSHVRAALAAAGPAQIVKHHRDPATRAYTHTARLSDGEWHCDCGVDWSEHNGSAHPW